MSVKKTVTNKTVNKKEIQMFPKRTPTESEKALCVALRYGSLTNYSTKKLTIATVARELRMPPSTCSAIINRFHRNGNQNLPRRVKPKAPFKMIPEKVREVLLSKEWLEEYFDLSLKKRVVVIKE